MSLFIGSGSNALRQLNLAARPFENRRPKRRVATLLWILAGVATAWNLFLFVEYWRGSSTGRDDLRTVRAEVDERVTAIRELESALRSADLSSQNEQVRFLNRKIAERTFPWSRLFDDLAEVLPRNVRLESLAPSIPESKKRRGQEIAESIEWIDLRLRGIGKTSEDILVLLDAMFSASMFASPVLGGERDADGQVEFDLSVRYRVNSPPPSVETLLQVTARDDESSEASAGSAAPGPSRNREPASAGPGPQASGVAAAAGAVDSGENQAASTDAAEASAQTTPSASATVESRPVRPRPASRQRASREPEPREQATPREQVRSEPVRDVEPEPADRGRRRDQPEPSTAPGRGVVPGFVGRGAPASGATAGTPVQTPQAAQPGQDPRRGQRRVITSDDVPQRTKDIADRRFGSGNDVAPRVDNASRGGG